MSDATPPSEQSHGSRAFALGLLTAALPLVALASSPGHVGPSDDEVLRIKAAGVAFLSLLVVALGASASRRRPSALLLAMPPLLVAAALGFTVYEVAVSRSAWRESSIAWRTLHLARTFDSAGAWLARATAGAALALALAALMSGVEARALAPGPRGRARGLYVLAVGIAAIAAVALGSAALGIQVAHPWATSLSAGGVALVSCVGLALAADGRREATLAEAHGGAAGVARVTASALFACAFGVAAVVFTGAARGLFFLPVRAFDPVADFRADLVGAVHDASAALPFAAAPVLAALVAVPISRARGAHVPRRLTASAVATAAAAFAIWLGMQVPDLLAGELDLRGVPPGLALAEVPAPKGGCSGDDAGVLYVSDDLVLGGRPRGSAARLDDLRSARAFVDQHDDVRFWAIAPAASVPFRRVANLVEARTRNRIDGRDPPLAWLVRGVAEPRGARCVALMAQKDESEPRSFHRSSDHALEVKRVGPDAFRVRRARHGQTTWIVPDERVATQAELPGAARAARALAGVAPAQLRATVVAEPGAASGDVAVAAWSLSTAEDDVERSGVVQRRPILELSVALAGSAPWLTDTVILDAPVPKADGAAHVNPLVAARACWAGRCSPSTHAARLGALASFWASVKQVDDEAFELYALLALDPDAAAPAGTDRSVFEAVSKKERGEVAVRVLEPTGPRGAGLAAPLAATLGTMRVCLARQLAREDIKSVVERAANGSAPLTRTPPTSHLVRFVVDVRGRAADAAFTSARIPSSGCLGAALESVEYPPAPELTTVDIELTIRLPLLARKR